MFGKLSELALRALCCAAIYALLYAWLGSHAWALVMVSPALGAAFAVPLIEAGSAAWRSGHQLAWRDVAGRHHAFQGQPVDVLDDEFGQPWVALPGLRRILPDLPPDLLLRQRFGDAWREPAGGQPARLRADALAQSLQAATQARSLRFRHWLERDVLFPARRRAERHRKPA